MRRGLRGRSNAEIVVVRPETSERRPVKLFPMVRMGDANDEFGPLLKRLAVQVHGSVFSDKVVDVGTGCDYACSLEKSRGYLAFPALCALLWLSLLRRARPRI